MITAIVLSAGKSSRMGSINKMLLPFEGSTLIGAVVANLIDSNIDKIIVVENRDTNISEHLDDNSKVTYTVNHKATEGLTSSIQCGIRSSNEISDGYLVCLGDMPLIVPSEYNFLISNFLKSPNKAILIPYFNKKRGNPVFFSSHFKEDILALKDPNGCRPIVQANQELVRQITFPTDHCLADIDTMEDYKNLAN